MTDIIDNSFVRNHFQWDAISDVDWSLVMNGALSARNVLAHPAKYPNADFDYLEKQDLELSLFLLSGPIEFIV